MAGSSIAWHIFCVISGLLWRLTQNVTHLVLRITKGSKKGMIPPIRDPVLLEPAVVLAAKIRSKKLKSETVVKAFIDRIREVDPLLNAVVEDRFAAAIEDAKGVDNYIQTCGKTPEQLAQEKPFLGVPFTTKDAICVKGLAMTAGVVARKHIKAPEDSDIVGFMRTAGAIPLCITNVCETCMWIDASNNLYGTTNNPYDLTRSPGGSSGGEGALIAAGASVFGLGSDIGGSIRVPSFFCGIFGHKPTRRTMSHRGEFPSTTGTVLDSYHVSGPMCRYAVDLVPMLKIIVAENISKLKLDTKVNMKDVKVYYTEDYITQRFTTPVDPEIRESVKKVVKQLQSTYGMEVKKVSIPLINKAWSIWLTKIAAADFGTTYENLGTNDKGDQLNLFVEFIKSIFRKCDHTLHFLYFILLSKIYRSPRLEAVNKENDILFDKLSQTFQDMLGNDGVFIFPTNPNTANYTREILMKFGNFVYTGLFNFLGNPVTQCPVGLSSEGLPLGVQVVANLHNDHLSLAVGKEIENLFGGWKSPCAILK